MKKLVPIFGWILALLTACSAAASGPIWTNASSGLSGAVPGVSQLVIDRVTGTTFYSLTSGGLFKSIDSGSSWTALGKIVGLSVLALDPTSASTIYAGAAHGVVTSTDGGASWRSAGLSDTSVRVLAVDPITPSTLYAGGNGHLYKSTDRGGSWTVLNLDPPPRDCGNVFIAAIVFDALSPSTLYVAYGSGPCGAFLKSLDGGESWKVINANAGPFYSGPPLVIDPSTPSTLYSINPLRKSMDGGLSWTRLPDPINVNGGYVAAALAVDPRNSNTLYLSTGDLFGQTIFKSPDGGQSWNAVDTIIPLANSLVFSPDSSTIYAGTGGGVFKSVDAGMNWGETNTGLRVLSIRMLVGDPVNPATIYAGGDEGLFKSVDSGGNWKKQAAFLLTPGGPFRQVAPAEVHSLLIDFSNPNILYLETGRPGGCYSGDVNLHKSTDGGANWSDLRLYQNDGCGTSGALMAVDPIDPNTLYLRFGDDYDGFTVLKTTDGGVSWSLTGLGGLNGLNALVIDPTTPATLYAATDSTSPEGSSVIGGVQKSTDGGATWNDIGLANQDVSLLAIDPLQPYVLYAGVSDHAHGCCFQGLFRSADSGASWSPINTGLGDLIDTPVNVNALIVDPGDSDVLYLGTSGYGVFKSSDGGATWAPYNDGLTFLDVRVLAIMRGASPAVFAGTPGGVFQIVDPSQ